MQVTSRMAHAKRESMGENDSDKGIILKALKRMKFGTKEDVAEQLKWSQDRVHKRLSDLKNDGLIKGTDIKKLAKTGHLQMVWALMGVKELKLAV